MNVSILAVAALFLVVHPAWAQDAERGRLLYETHCGGCHAERLHDRPKSRIASLADLRLQVARWTKQTGRQFTEGERADLVEFLDATHYRLGARAPLTPAKPAQ